MSEYKIYILTGDDILTRTVTKELKSRLPGAVIVDNFQNIDANELKTGVVVGEQDSEAGLDIGVGEAYRGSAKRVVFEVEDVTQEICDEAFARKVGQPLEIMQTERFVVREITNGDMDSLYELYDSLGENSYVEPLYEREEEEEFTKNYIENMYGFFGYGLWLVFAKDTGELVARIGIENRSIDGVNCQELGYVVKRDWQKLGVAYEVCSGILRMAGDRYGIERMFICTDKNNIPSQALARKLGFSPYALDCDGMNLYCLSI